jgi:hypothetical protein
MQAICVKAMIILDDIQDTRTCVECYLLRNAVKCTITEKMSVHLRRQAFFVFLGSLYSPSQGLNADYSAIE